MCLARLLRSRFAATFLAVLWVLLTAARSSAVDAKPVERPGAGAAPANGSAAVMGTLAGRFVFAGPRPERKLFEIPAEPVKDRNGRVYGTSMDNPYFHKFQIYDNSLLVGEDGGIANVLVWVRKNVPQSDAAELAPITITVSGGYVEPRIVICRTPRKLIIKNEEDIPLIPNYQGQFSQFNPLIKPHEQSAFTPNPEFVPVRIGHLACWNVVGYVLPLGHSFVAQSDAHGDFRIAGLPPGDWEFNVWHERKGYVTTDDWPKGRFTFAIKPGDNSLGTVKLTPALFNEPAPQ